MNAVKVVLDDTEKLFKTLKDLANSADVLVGIPSDKDDRPGEPIGNASIGYINEKGSAKQGIPPRPFLEPGVAAVSQKCASIIGIGAAEALASFDPKRLTVAKGRAGTIARDSVKKTLVAGDGFPPIAKSTIYQRLHRTKTAKSMTLANGEARVFKPLIDTGSLLNSITYVLRKRGA